MSETRTSLFIGLGLAAAVVVGLVFLTVAGARMLLNEPYPQDTPEEVLASARLMVENGDAHRLPDLVYADDDRMRGFLNEFGRVLASLETLAGDVGRAYPEEIEAMRAEAEAAAASGQASSHIQKLMSQATQGMAGRRRRGGGPGGINPEEQQTLFNNAAKELVADPYGWLARSEDRLTVQTVTDDTSAILWDGKPVFGVGLLMRREEGKWYVALPTHAPPLSKVMPKSDDAWEIMGSLMTVFESAVQDLSKDVRSGKARRLEDLARAAGEKAFVPAIIVIFAYGKAMEAEKKELKKQEAGGSAVGGG